MADGELLGRAVLELTTDQKGLDAGLELAQRKTIAATAGMQQAVTRGASAQSQAVSRSMGLSAQATREAAVRLQGYELAVQGAQTRVAQLSRAVQAGTGDQQKLNEALHLAEGRLSLAQQKLDTHAQKTRAAAAETRSLAGETGISSRAFSDLSSHMGPVGRTLDDLTTRTRLYRHHGVDYLAAGVLGLEGALFGLSVKAAIHFEELSNTVRRQTGLSGGALEELMGTIRTVARDSPYQLGQVADASVILRQEFHQTDAQIKTSANLMVAFAAATGEDVRPQMQQLDRIMTQFRQPLSHVVGLTDKLVAVAQATQQPLGAMVGVLDRFGPKLQALGFSLDDSVKLLAVFQASGIKTDAMGRGLSAALAAVTKAQGDHQKLLADGPAKLATYGTAVQSAQLRVDTLSARLASGKGNQQLLNEQMTIAQQKLTEAKGRYDGLNSSLAHAKTGHADIAATIKGEISQIVHAHSRQDALNIAVADFGKNLGPSMARAYYQNQAALEKVDKALKTTGATQRLFGVDQKSLAGETQAAKNNFQDLEITIGTKVVPALSDAMKWVRGAAHDIDDFYKHHHQLVEMALAIGGIGSAVTLLSRHSPLGRILGGLLQTSSPGAVGGARRGVAGFLQGPGADGMMGVRGPVGAGSLTNPVAVAIEGGGGGGLGGRGAPGTTLSRSGTSTGTAGRAVGAAEKEAQGLSSKLGGLAAGFAKVALPLAGVMGLVNALSGSGGAGGKIPAFAQRFLSGATGGLLTPPKSAGAQFSAELSKASGAKALEELRALTRKELDVGVISGKQAERQLAAILAKEKDIAAAGIRGMLRGVGAIRFPTEPMFVRDIAKHFKGLSKTGREQGADAMIELSRSMEREGRLPKGSTDKLIADLEAKYPALAQFIVATGHGSMQDLATEFKSQKVIQSVDDQVAQIQKDWGLLPDLAKSNGQNVYANWKAAIDAVKTKMKTGSADSRHAAETEYRKLLSMQDDVTGTMVTHWSNQLDSMKGTSATDFGKMASAGVAALTGIGLSTNAALKALHLTPVDFGISQVTSAAASAYTSTLGSFLGLTHRAGGGLIQIGRPGAAGRDTVALNVGGIPVAVGEGEQVAVFNRHQIPEANARFADEGGLAGFFARRKRPNYMASGGIVTGPASTFGPPTEAAGSTASGVSDALPGISLHIPGTHFSDAANRALMGHVFRVALAGHSANLRDIDLGPADYLHRAIDITGAGARAMGIDPFQFPTGAIASATATDGTAVAGGEQIRAPHIRGPAGPLTKLVQAMADKIAAGANRYVTDHTPAISAGAGGGGPPSGPAGTTAFEGVTVAKWIAQELAWARSHGWVGSGPTSGYRPGYDPHTATGTSEHQGIQYPGGAVDLGGYTLSASQMASKLSLLHAIAGYPGPHLIPAQGFYDQGHLSGTGHALGGLVRGYAAGTAKVKGPKLRKAPKPKAPPRLPRLRALPGFDQGLLAQLTGLDTNVSELGNWQSYLQSLHGAVEDPTPAQRLQQIGDPGANPNRTATRDINTELGVDETILDKLLAEQQLAARASGELSPWIARMTGQTGQETAEISWLTQALGTGPLPRIGGLFRALGTVSLGTRVGGRPWNEAVATRILRMARDYKNAAAQIRHWQERKAKLPLEQKAREAKISARFAAARHRLSLQSLTGSFDASTLHAAQSAELAAEERSAVAGIQTKPRFWVGDEVAWADARKHDHEHVAAEFAARRQALAASFAAKGMQGRISRSNALFGLTQSEAAQKLTVSQQFGYQKIDLANLIGERQSGQSTDKTYLQGLLAQLKSSQSADQAALDAATTQGGFRDTLAGYLDPLGALSIAVAQKQTIDIPALLREIANLSGTTPQTPTPADMSGLLALEQQRSQQLATELAVSQAQYKVLAALPPFVGSYEHGGIVPGPAGQAMTAIVHGGEEYLGVGERKSAQVKVRLEDHRVRVWVDDVEQIVAQQTATGARRVRRALPGTGGGGYR